MPQTNIDAQLNTAWGYHRQGQNDVAIAEFEKALAAAPDSIDARYGIGLALRASGQEARAVEVFQKAYEAAKEALRAVRAVAEAQGVVVSGNDLSNPEDDRYMMLVRMISQRLTELGAPPAN
jgi:tetratricopeptide (TPR) repeat protein